MKTGVTVFLAALALATGANAQTHAGYQEKLTGTITGVDTFGIFGAANANLSGKTFSEIFFVDPTKGQLQVTSTGEVVSGGSATSYSDPVSVGISINGGSYIYFGSGSSDYYGSASLSNQAGSGKASATVVSVSANKTVEFAFDFSGNTLNRFGQSEAVAGPVGSNSITASNGGCDVETLKLTTAVFAAPEPSIWALMLGGVALLGLGLRTTPSRRVRLDLARTISA